MNDEFINKGIEKDRYLKAKQLGDSFENEVYELITDVFSDFVEQSKLFQGNGSPNPKSTPTAGQATKATLRIDYKLVNVEAEDVNNPNRLKLSFAINFCRKMTLKSAESSHQYFRSTFR